MPSGIWDSCFRKRKKSHKCKVKHHDGRTSACISPNMHFFHQWQLHLQPTEWTEREEDISQSFMVCFSDHCCSFQLSLSPQAKITCTGCIKLFTKPPLWLQFPANHQGASNIIKYLACSVNSQSPEQAAQDSPDGLPRKSLPNFKVRLEKPQQLNFCPSDTIPPEPCKMPGVE